MEFEWDYQIAQEEEVRGYDAPSIGAGLQKKNLTLNAKTNHTKPQRFGAIA